MKTLALISFSSSSLLNLHLNSRFFEDLFFEVASSSSSESEASFLDFFFFSVSGDDDFRLTVLFSEFSDSRFFSDECLDFFLTCFSSSLSDSSRLLLLEAFFDHSSPFSSLSLSSFFDFAFFCFSSSLSLSSDELLLDLDFTSLLFLFEGDSSSESS